MSHPPLNPALFHLDPDHLWVMHCAEGPVPRAGMRAVRAFMQKELRPWEVAWEEDFHGLPAAVRREAAALVGGRPEDISLTPTTSSGLQTVAQAYPWREGDEVLAPLGEFPSNAWPWLAQAGRGVGFREVPLWRGHGAGTRAWEGAPPDVGTDPEAALLGALGPRTRILAVSWVRFQDGLRLDLPRLGRGCQARGVDLVVDGIQGAGCLPVDLESASAFATGGYKGLLSPEGLGFLWTSEAFRARLHPTGSWLSVEEAGSPTRVATDLSRAWQADGRRLEPGGPNLLHAAALRTSLELLNSVGMEALAAHIGALQETLLAALAGSAWAEEVDRLEALRRADRLGPFLAFHHGGRGQEGLQALLEAGLRRGIYASVREGYLRIAFHGFHRETDALRVAAWLRASG